MYPFADFTARSISSGCIELVSNSSTIIRRPGRSCGLDGRIGRRHGLTRGRRGSRTSAERPRPTSRCAARRLCSCSSPSSAGDADDAGSADVANLLEVEGRDLLGLAVFTHDEVVGLQALDDRAVLVADDDVDPHEVGAGAEHGRRAPCCGADDSGAPATTIVSPASTAVGISRMRIVAPGPRSGTAG
jgi:hypothetical protein